MRTAREIDHTSNALIAVVALAAIGLVVSALLNAVRAAEPAYCALWAREQTRIDFIAAIDNPRDAGDSLSATPEAIEGRLGRNYSLCRVMEVRPLLEGGDAMKTVAWVASMHQLLRGRFAGQGTVPAGDRPTPDGWAAACAAEWRSFDPEDGTVIRPRSKGGKVRCPLVLVDGRWVIP